jgi:cytochrome d ubiquinol oxidase subunit I
VSLIALTDVDLARIQFGMTSLYHFLFVPLTLGLGAARGDHADALAAHRRRRLAAADAVLRRAAADQLRVGVATGLVQEFQFGMNWSVYSEYVGGVFGAPLAIEGLAAFFLEATFLGLWVFGWDRLSPRVHLATIWLAAPARGSRRTSSSSRTRGCSGRSASRSRAATRS